MKTVKTVLLLMLTGIFVAGGVSAQDSGYPAAMQESVKNWLSSSASSANDTEHTISAPTPDPTVPVGDSLFTAVLLSGLYLLWNRKKRKAALRISNQINLFI
jgi:hypothetical protein